MHLPSKNYMNIQRLLKFCLLSALAYQELHGYLKIVEFYIIKMHLPVCKEENSAIASKEVHENI